jgi:uncharacterized protein (UPF0335 family)
MTQTKGSEGLNQSNAKGRLLSFIERVESLNNEIKAIQDDKSEVFKEARGEGWDVKAIKAIIQMRAKPEDERIEHETIVDTYLVSLGMK